MYKILIADDAKIERDCITFLIEKYTLPLSPQTACNGKEALELLNREYFDILFTDIKMPFMDGLELSKAAMLLNPALRIIIFSGYHEFEYAKTAIALGVGNYLLKPINPEEFLSVSTKLIVGLREQEDQRRLHQKRMNGERNHLLLMLINSVPEKMVAQSLYRHDDSPLPDFINEYSQMLLLECRLDIFNKMGRDFEERARVHFQAPFDYLNVNPNQSLLFFKGHGKGEDWLKSSQELCHWVEREFGWSFYVAFSGDIGEKKIGQVYRELEELLEKRFFFPNRQVFYHCIEYTNAVSHEDSISLEILQNDIKLKDYTTLREHLEYIFSSLRSAPGYSELYIKFLFSSIFKEIMSLLPSEFQVSLEPGIVEIYQGDSIQYIEEIISSAINLLEETMPKASLHISRIEAVKQYIDKHYDQDLSLDILSKEVYLHPDYLCRIFKQETGTTLNKFIKSRRMEEARTLLEGSQIPIRAVCNAVGYQNFSYFCQSFRDYWGVNPERMRQSGQEDVQ